jgi:hypothetical protein
MSNAKEFVELVKILSESRIGGMTMDFWLLVDRMHENFEQDGKTSEKEDYDAALMEFKTHVDSIGRYFLQNIKELCTESDRNLSLEDIDELAGLADILLDSDRDLVCHKLKEDFPGPWDSNWKIQKTRAIKTIIQKLESLQSGSRKQSKSMQGKSNSSVSKAGSEHIVRRFMRNIEKVSPKRFPYSFVEDLSGNLIYDFMERHSISVVGWVRFWEEKTDPFFTAIVDAPIGPWPSSTLAEWDLYRIHLMTSDSGLTALVKVSEFSASRLSLDHLIKPSRKVAMINYYLQWRPIFDEAWVLRSLRSIPQEDWTIGIKCKQRKDFVHEQFDVALAKEMSSFMSEQLGRLHDCRVKVLLDHFVGTYWIVYPHEYRVEFDEIFEGREVKMLRPAYEMVFFEPDNESSVDFYYRGLPVDKDIIINIWMDVAYKNRIESLATATMVNGIRLSPDKRGIWLIDQYYQVSLNEFSVIEFYLNATISGRPKLSQKHVLEELDISSKRISNVFKLNSELYQKIFDHDNSGIYWLKKI